MSDYGFPTTSTEESLTGGSFDHVTATWELGQTLARRPRFHLLAQQVFRGRVGLLTHLHFWPRGPTSPTDHGFGLGAETCEALEA